MAKYATYFRVSTENQGKSGLGLQAQQEAVQRFMKQDDSCCACLERPTIEHVCGDAVARKVSMVASRVGRPAAFERRLIM
jgi:hypothetical protein